jgi:hypothetical protein
MSDPSFDRLKHSTNVFIQAIESLSDDLFLRSIDEWTPRDVAAHLTWWNRNMIAASQSLQAGAPPSYYADAMNDYRNINARAIAEFPSQDRRVLLNELRATLDELERYLLALGSQEWDADHGVQHHRGGSATIRRIVESLAGDYQHHARQVEEWRARVR